MGCLRADVTDTTDPDAESAADGPHQGQPLRTAGTELEEATAAAVLVHGRGATAQSILRMGGEFHRDGLALLAPQAARNEWYPHSFLEPVERNEPGRTSGLRAVGDAVSAANDAGIPTDRILVLGFSQGACLATEYVARNPRRYGGIVALSGGLIGETVAADSFDGSLEGTPAFVGCSDADPHIPVERVHTTTAVLERLGADVDERIYEGMGHGVNEDELGAVRELVDALVD
jgi:phospholipase/carboxylesterase